MQRTVRILRVALPIAIVAFVLLIVVSWNRSHGKRDNARNDPPEAGRSTTDVAVGVATTFEDTQTIGGRVVSRIRAQRVIAFKSAWSTLENVQLTIYRLNGLTYELLCPQAEYNSETKEANAKGGVQLTTSDGVQIATAEIHYDGSRLMNRIPVQFRIDDWRGKAGALDLDVPGETLRLFQTITATMTPTVPGDMPMTLDATDGLFRRRENDVTFTEKVVMTRGADRLKGDRIVGRFTQDRKRIIGMEGIGNVNMIMSGAAMPGENLGGRKEITCERFFSDLGPDGRFTGFTAVSDTGLVHAVLDGPPKRDLTAHAMHIGLQGRAVSEMKAEFEVSMREYGETRREVSTDKLTVNFDPAQHKATTAFMEGNFKYRDPKNTASAVRANYDIANDRVLLTASPGFDPTVVTDGQTLKAKQIEFSPKAGTAKATGEVIAQLVSKGGGPSADSTNLFPTGTPVFVNADLLIMRQATKTAVFSGSVKAWQDANTIFAQELQVQGPGQTITARGNVRSLLYNTSAEGRKTPIVSQSEQLVVHRNDQRVELIGGVKIDDEARTLNSEHATLFFDSKKKIDRIEAENKVTLLEKSTSRKVTGDKATYLVNKKMAYLNGKPATATDPSGTVSGEQIVFDLTRNRFQVQSVTDKTSGTYKQQ